MSTITKATRAAAALATAGVLALLSAPAALAAGPADLDPAGVGSITVHKYSEAAAKGAPASGSDDDTQVPEGATPLAGVSFDAFPVAGIDLTDNAGWDAAEALAPGSFTYDAAAGTITTTGDPATTYTLGEPVTLTDADGNPATDANGEAGAADLALGAWLVVETGSDLTDPQAAITGAAAPFVVTVPLPTGDGSWNWDVHAYPKNSVASASKAIDADAAFTVGDTVTFDVTVNPGWLPDGQAFETFAVNDRFNDALTPAGVTSIVQGETVFVADEDYTVTTDGQLVSAVFTPAGLAKLAQGADVVATFATTVDDDIFADTDGIVPNVAWADVNDAAGDPDDPDDPGNPGVPTNEVEADFGGLAISKVAEGDSAKALSGASFEVANAAGDLVATITSGDDGQIATATDADGDDLTVTDGHIALKAGDYTLTETVAPAGYETITDPIAVTIVTGQVTGAEAVQVVNVQKPPVELPFSGGIGTVLFTLGGLVVLAGAGATWWLLRRRGAQASGTDA